MGSSTRSTDIVADDQRPELAAGARWWDQPFIVLDTETTSADPLQARIVQLACAAIYPDGHLSSGSYVKLVNAGVPIPLEASAVHGITQPQVEAEGVPLADALYELLRRLERWGQTSPVVIFNAVYDWPLVWEELGRSDLVWTDPLANAQLLDPLVIERQFNGVSKGHYSNKLSDVALRYHIPVAQAHDALGDAVMTAAVLRAQVERYPVLRKLTVLELMVRQRAWFGTWRDTLNAYNTRKGKPWRVSGEWPFGDRKRTAR